MGLCETFFATFYLNSTVFSEQNNTSSSENEYNLRSMLYIWRQKFAKCLLLNNYTCTNQQTHYIMSDSSKWSNFFKMLLKCNPFKEYYKR